MAACEDVAARVAELRRQVDVDCEAQRRNPHSTTPAESERRLKSARLMRVDDAEETGLLIPERANEARALVLDGESLDDFAFDDTPATRRWAEEKRKQQAGMIAFHQAARRAQRDARRMDKSAAELAFRPVRTRHTNRGNRRSSRKRTMRTASVGDRGDPSPGEDPDPLPLADWPQRGPHGGWACARACFGRCAMSEQRRPAGSHRVRANPRAGTAFQRSLQDFRCVLAATRDELTVREFDALVDVLTAWCAAEHGKRVERERRP